MKIVVNRGRSVQIAVKPGIAAEGTKPAVRPVVKNCGPGSLLEMPDEEAKFLIQRGVVRKYEPGQAVPNPEPANAPDSADDAYRPGMLEEPENGSVGLRRG